MGLRGEGATREGRKRRDADDCDHENDDNCLVCEYEVGDEPCSDRTGFGATRSAAP